MRTVYFIAKILALSAIILALVNCSDKKKSNRASVRDRQIIRDPVTGGPTTINAATQGAEWGEVTTGGEMQQVVAQFLDDSSGTIGSVSGVSGASTGVRFRGKADDIRPQGNYLEIIIADSLAQQQGYIVVRMNSCQAQVNAARVTVVCQDDYGQVFLEGDATQTLYSGQMRFENKSGSKGNLGTFKINTQTFLNATGT